MITFVCPDTKSPLKEVNGKLVSEEGVEYDYVYGIPLLVNRKNLPSDYAEKGEKAFSRVKYGVSWMMNHFYDLDIKNLIGPAKNQGDKMLCLGGGDLREKAEMVKLGYEPISIEIDPIEGVDVVGDVHFLPFKDETFDIVTSWEVFEHLHSPWIVIKEINRVLKPGGRLVGSVAFMKSFHSSYFHMSHWGVHSLLTSHGFEIDKIYGGQNFVPWTTGVYLPKKILYTKKIPLFFYNLMYKIPLNLKLWVWKLKGRNIHEPKNYDRFFKLSFKNFNQIMTAATVLFSSRKIN
ncbi:MAG: class I SAM-dependent methyltransferase [Flavobacteriales bacterium]|nr:class I SAM-dependent methyltransferase [Flavobacteriales bacterium]